MKDISDLSKEAIRELLYNPPPGTAEQYKKLNKEATGLLTLNLQEMENRGDEDVSTQSD